MSTKTIAVIDDNQAWIEAVKDSLAEDGFEVCAATTEEQALQLFDGIQPRLVILDVHIPGSDGIRILSDFRAHDRLTPVLVVSADDRALVRHQAMSGGASGFLRKPISPDLLRRAVKRFTSLSGRRETSCESASRIENSTAPSR